MEGLLNSFNNKKKLMATKIAKIVIAIALVRNRKNLAITFQLQSDDFVFYFQHLKFTYFNFQYHV